MTSKCPHETTRQVWRSPGIDMDGEPLPSRWITEFSTTCVDIDTGRFRCTECGEVMYYTGKWKKYWEEGVEFE